MTWYIVGKMNRFAYASNVAGQGTVHVCRVLNSTFFLKNFILGEQVYLYVYQRMVSQSYSKMVKSKYRYRKCIKYGRTAYPARKLWL